MKHILFAATAAALLASGYAVAQDATLTIEPTHRTIIHQYVVKERMAPVRVKESIAVGAVSERRIRLHSCCYRRNSHWTGTLRILEG